MKENRKDSSDKDQLPTASRLTPEDEAMFAAAPPKVKGYHIISTPFSDFVFPIAIRVLRVLRGSKNQCQSASSAIHIIKVFFLLS